MLLCNPTPAPALSSPRSQAGLRSADASGSGHLCTEWGPPPPGERPLAPTSRGIADHTVMLNLTMFDARCNHQPTSETSELWVIVLQPSEVGALFPLCLELIRAQTATVIKLKRKHWSTSILYSENHISQVLGNSYWFPSSAWSLGKHFIHLNSHVCVL